MVQNENKKILLHACCAICSGYPISLLKEIGYSPIVYFCNPNLDTQEEFDKRLSAQKQICNYFNVPLIIESYNPEVYLNYVLGLENEPEKGSRCSKCIELRLNLTAKKAIELEIPDFTTSLPISPHKNFNKISEIGSQIASKNHLNYLSIDFKKKDGFLKTNNLAKNLNLYRQNYCGCKFAKK